MDISNSFIAETEEQTFDKVCYHNFEQNTDEDYTRTYMTSSRSSTSLE